MRKYTYIHKIILYCYTDKSEDVGDVINSLFSLWLTNPDLDNMDNRTKKP